MLEIKKNFNYLNLKKIMKPKEKKKRFTLSPSTSFSFSLSLSLHIPLYLLIPPLIFFGLAISTRAERAPSS